MSGVGPAYGVGWCDAAPWEAPAVRVTAVSEVASRARHATLGTRMPEAFAVTAPSPADSVRAVTIKPDVKDWTWVLERPCPECGYDASAVPPGTVADRLRVNAD